MSGSRGGGLWSEALQGKEEEGVERFGFERENNAVGSRKSPTKGRRKKE